jgi:hypothetical protein
VHVAVADFQGEEHADPFDTTAAKHGRTFFDTLVMLAEGRPWLPTSC